MYFVFKSSNLLSGAGLLSTVAAIFVFGFAPSLNAAQLSQPGSGVEAVHDVGLKLDVSLTDALSGGDVTGHEFVDFEAIQAFYERRDNKPYWTGGYFTKGPAGAFEQTIRDSWQHGLNPYHYNLSALEADESLPEISDRAQRELLLTDAFIRYVRDMSGMRVDPSGLRVDRRSWRVPVSPAGALAMLENYGSVSEALESIEPQGQTYKLLQKELIRLSAEPDEPYAHILPIKVERLLRPGQRHDAVPDLRVRLNVDAQTQDELLYDDRLAAAVIRFQRENELKDDAIIGAQTLEVLNRTKVDLMTQVIANLERLRWVDEDRPEKFVVVNVPSATLWAVDDNQVEFEMPVIVGRPKRPTDSFITEIRGVRFNPNWTVPPTIKREDVLSDVRADPEYFTKKGIEIFDGYGRDSQTLDPAAIDWETITWPELNALRMVQTPGRHNALGEVRVLMPNKFNIYLHDTNHRNLFNSPARALSSGCIRLKDPRKLASFIMRGTERWSDEKMLDIFSTGKTTERYNAQRIPVYILYYTIWVGKDGRIVYGSDIYDQDRLLVEKLAKVDGFAIPGHNGEIVANSGRPKFALN